MYRLLYLIEILHQTTTLGGRLQADRSCILSKFYIKPQLFVAQNAAQYCCILSKFYIKPQHRRVLGPEIKSCILSKFYIKPQQSRKWIIKRGVVSYRNSTSNHNAVLSPLEFPWLYLIEILHQTTTLCTTAPDGAKLYLIEILHQTTTRHEVRIVDLQLYLIEILHQTTTRSVGAPFEGRVVSYRNSTSNHNLEEGQGVADVVVSYRNSTSNHNVGPHID